MLFFKLFFFSGFIQGYNLVIVVKFGTEIFGPTGGHSKVLDCPLWLSDYYWLEAEIWNILQNRELLFFLEMTHVGLFLDRVILFSDLMIHLD